MSEPILKLQNVTMQFGGVVALNDVSFEIKKQEILGLIGPNGAGKTTVFNVITGVYQVTKGDISFEGKSLKGTRRYKIWAFVLGASVGGAAGVLYASKTLFISPDNFTLQVSILILACVVFGGMGNIWGVVLGAIILGYLPDRIRFISDARLLVFGAVLVLMMNLRPDGLLPRKKREKALPEKGQS